MSTQREAERRREALASREFRENPAVATRLSLWIARLDDARGRARAATALIALAGSRRAVYTRKEL
jgi:hypothetical protein